MNKSFRNVFVSCVALPVIVGCGGSSGGDDNHGTEPPPTGGVDATELRHAKQFVQDLRDLRVVFDEDIVNEQNNGSGEVFSQKLAAAAEAVGDQDYVEPLGYLADLINWYVDNFDELKGDFNPENTVDLALLVDVYPNSIPHTITGELNGDESGRDLSIEADVDGILFELSFDLTDVNDSPTDEVVFAVHGQISEGEELLEIKDGSFISVTNSEELDLGEPSNVEADQIVPVSLAFDLMIEIATKYEGKDTSFEGKLAFDLLLGVNFVEGYGEYNYECYNSFQTNFFEEASGNFLNCYVNDLIDFYEIEFYAAMSTSIGFLGEFQFGDEYFDAEVSLSSHNAEQFLDGVIEIPGVEELYDVSYSLENDVLILEITDEQIAGNNSPINAEFRFIDLGEAGQRIGMFIDGDLTETYYNAGSIEESLSGLFVFAEGMIPGLFLKIPDLAVSTSGESMTAVSLGALCGYYVEIMNACNEYQEENEQTWHDADMSISINTKLNGVEGVDMSLAGKRDSFTSGTFSFDIDYNNGRALSIKSTGNSEAEDPVLSFVAENELGVKLIRSETEEEKLLIMVGEKQMGYVVETNDVVVVHYVDDTVETL